MLSARLPVSRLFALATRSLSGATERKWTVNGTINYLDNDRDKFFYADVRDQVEPLVDRLEDGAFVIYHGARGCGKSTKASVAQALLKQRGYRVVSMSLQGRTNYSSTDRFWSSFGLLFRRRAEIQAPVESLEQFVDLFDRNNEQSPFKDDKVVLFIDEFDLLSTEGSQQITSSMLNCLRELKNNRAHYYLHGVCVIGPFSVLKLTGQTGSPFNVSEAVPTPWLTPRHVAELFQQWQQVSKIAAVDERIVEDVWQRTSGHAGLVQKCGKEMDEVLLRGHTSVSYERWLQHAVVELPRNLYEWGTMRKMFDLLRRDQPDIRAARQLLATTFLPTADAFGPLTSTDQARLISDPRQSQLAEFLAAEGALVSVNKSNRFVLPSPLIAAALMTQVLPIDRPPIVPDVPFPFRPDKSIDVQAAVLACVRLFDAQGFQTSARLSWKQNPRRAGQSVCKEAVYHFHLYNMLRAWAPTEVVFAPETNVGSKQRCDIFMQVASHRYVIELMATDTAAAVQEHIERTADYAKALEASEAWMLHFRQDDELPAPGADEWPSQPVVNVVQIVHKSDWSSVRVFAQRKELIGPAENASQGIRGVLRRLVGMFR